MYFVPNVFVMTIATCLTHAADGITNPAVYVVNIKDIIPVHLHIFDHHPHPTPARQHNKTNAFNTFAPS